MIEEFQREGVLLDVGCGTGEFLSYMQKFQWKVTGVEPDADARTYATSRGLRVLPELQRIQRGRFQVITLWHVLEHLPDLRKSAEHLVSLLEPSGYLVLAMPNVDAFDAREYGEHWVALDTPRHLYHFTQNDVQELFKPFPIELVSAGGLWLDTIYNVLYSEQLYHAQTGERYRPFSMLRTLIRSYSDDVRSDQAEASASVYIFQKEQTHA
jgi:SAM-dependent methyltransferase